MFEWPPPDSAAARIDEQDWLARVAKDLNKCEPLKRPQPVADTVSRRDLKRAMDGIVQTIAKACRELVVMPLVARIKELEAREWLGVFEEGKAYSKGAIVTHDGSAWVATRDYPEAKPGAGPACGWRLIVKRGRDGKDATK